MGLKEKVYDSMKKPKGITVKEIAKELDISEKAVNSYIWRLTEKNGITDIKIIDKIYLNDNTGKKGKKYYLYRVLAKSMDKSLKNPLDTQILEKMIIPFAEYKINIVLEDNEIKRIKELHRGVNNA